MKQRFYRWLAKWRLIRRYEYLIEVNRLMEEFTTETIIAGGSEEFLGQSRKQLIALQNDNKSQERLLEFLKRI